MGWADAHIEMLDAGKTITFSVPDKRLEPFLSQGERIYLSADSSRRPEPNDIILCTRKRKQMIRRVLDVRPGQVLVGASHMAVDGWCNWNRIHGYVGSNKPNDFNTHRVSELSACG